MRSHSSSEVRSRGALSAAPALLTRMSTWSRGRAEGVEGGGDGGAVGDVHHEHGEGGGWRGEGGGDRVQLGAGAAGEDEAGALRREALRDGAADATAAAGDQGRLAVEGHARPINGSHVKLKRESATLREIFEPGRAVEQPRSLPGEPRAPREIPVQVQPNLSTLARRGPGSECADQARRLPGTVAVGRAWWASGEPGGRRATLVGIGRAWWASGESARPILSCSQNFRKFSPERRACSQNADQARRTPTRLAECRPGSQNADQARRMPTRLAERRPGSHTVSLLAGRRAWLQDAERGRRMMSLLAVRVRAGSPSGELTRRRATTLGVGRPR